jgi:hypothetical protein
VTEQEIRALLAAAVAYDNRRPANANVIAWEEAANRAGWTFDAALDAVHAHYAESAAWLMPGHITARLAAAKSDPSWPAPYAALPAAQPADETTRRRIMAMIGDTFGLRLARQRRPRPNTRDHARARVAAKVALDAKRAALDALLPAADGEP